MFIEKVHIDHRDETTGAKVLTIKTKKGESITPTRIFNNPEYQTLFQEFSSYKLPSMAIEISEKIDDLKMVRLKKNFSNKRKEIRRKIAPLKGKKIVKYFPAISYVVYDKDNIITLINLQIESGVDIISIPDFGEKLPHFEDKIRFTEKSIEKHPEYEVLDIMPYICSDSKDFKDKLNTIVEMGYDRVGIDFKGYRASESNLNTLQNFIRIIDKDIWIHMSNLPRKVASTRASTPHLLTYYGVDSYSFRVYPPPKYLYDPEKKQFPKRKISDIEYFDSSSLGILRQNDLPLHFGIDCTCPYHKKEDLTFFTEDGDQMANRSRICEMCSGQLEFERAKKPIEEGTFKNYLRRKEYINRTLDIKRLSEF